MSLKAFHIFFIAVSVVVTLVFGVWELLSFAESGDVGELLLGVASFIVAIGLVVYGVRFLKKLKHIGYL